MDTNFICHVTRVGACDTAYTACANFMRYRIRGLVKFTNLTLLQLSRLVLHLKVWCEYISNMCSSVSNPFLPAAVFACILHVYIMAEPSTSSSGAAAENSRTPVQACLEHPKRTRGSPTLLTPHRPQKRRPLQRDAGPTPPGQPRRLGFESPRAPAPVPQQGLTPKRRH